MSMKVESNPVTGNEDKQTLAAPLRALSDFYTAFNNADLALMSGNWAQTDEVIMNNPICGIMHGWNELRAVHERIYVHPFRGISLAITQRLFSTRTATIRRPCSVASKPSRPHKALQPTILHSLRYGETPAELRP